MHRGTMFVITKDNEVWKSTEFNGGMGLDCYGKDVMKVFEKVETLQDFKNFVLAFDKTHHNYNDEVMFYKAIEQKQPYIDDKGMKYFDFYKKKNQYSFFRDSKKQYIYTSDSNYIKNLSDKNLEIICENGTFILKPNQIMVTDYDTCINNTGKSFDKEIDKEIHIDRLSLSTGIDKTIPDKDDMDYEL